MQHAVLDQSVAPQGVLPLCGSGIDAYRAVPDIAAPGMLMDTLTSVT